MTAILRFVRWGCVLFLLSMTAAKLNAQSLAELSDLPTLLQRHAELNIPRGDVDENGEVEFPDFLIMSSHYGQEVAGYDNGDLNLDGFVDLGDYVFLTHNFGESNFAPDPIRTAPNANLGLSVDDENNLIVSSAAPVEVSAIEMVAPNRDLAASLPAAMDSAHPFPFYLARDLPRVTWANLARSLTVDGDWNTFYGSESGAVTLQWIEPGSVEVFSHALGEEGDALTGRQAFARPDQPVRPSDPPEPDPYEPNEEVLAILNNAADEASLVSLHQDNDIPRGDTEAKGIVAFADFLQLSNNFNTTAASYDQGDFNLDGNVSFEDFAILSNNFGKDGYQPEPPPTTKAPLSLGLDDFGRMVVQSSENASLLGMEFLSEQETLLPARDSTPFAFFLAVDASQLTTGHLGIPVDVRAGRNFIVPTNISGSSEITMRWIQNGSYEVFEDTFALEYSLESSLGDIDRNGTIEFADFLVLAHQYGNQVPPFSGGDIDGDGFVQFPDFVFLSAFFGQNVRDLEVSPVPVPEPGGYWMSVYALTLFTARVRQRLHN